MAEEKAEDEALRVEKKRKVKRVAAIDDDIFGGVIGVALGMGKPGREQTKSDRWGGMRLSKLERRADKQEVEKAKLEHELEKLLVRGIKAASPGSYDQRDLVGQLERLRAVKQAPAVGGVACDANGPLEYAG